MKYLQRIKLFESKNDPLYPEYHTDIQSIRFKDDKHFTEDLIQRTDYFYGKGSYDKLKKTCDDYIRILSTLDTSYIDSKFIDITDRFSDDKVIYTHCALGLAHGRDYNQFITYKYIDRETSHSKKSDEWFSKFFICSMLTDNTSFERDGRNPGTTPVIKQFDINDVIEDYLPGIDMSIDCTGGLSRPIKLKRVEKEFQKIIIDMDDSIPYDTEIIWDPVSLIERGDMDIYDYSVKIVIKP